ncbi:MAG: hypothetical protein LBI55_02730 [Oscillospiraceae bacterium]|jgi:lipopolysaccharide biosynthesis glycosyltransferase|nr:hypothetical protein [Oscillospiraceae bacterium]
MYKKKTITILSLALFIISASLIIALLYFLNTSVNSGKELPNPTSSIPIVMLANDDDSYSLSVCVSSAIQNKNQDTKYEFYFLCSSDFTDIAKNRLSAVQAQYKEIKFNFIDSTKILKKIKTDFVDIGTFPDCRLHLSSLLPRLNKIVYLEYNAVVNKDLSYLFEKDLSNICVAGVKDEEIMDEAQWWCKENKKDSYPKDILGIESMDQYINSSVLLLNLANMRAQDIEKRCEECLENVSNSRNYGIYPIQDILNSVFYNKILVLGSSISCFADSKNSDSEASLVTYYLKDKVPIDSDKSSHKDLWWKYAKSCAVWEDISKDYCSDLDMHVFLCADNGNVVQTAATIASLLDHSSNYEKITIHLIGFSGNEMSKSNKDKISSLKQIKDFSLDFMAFNKRRLAGFKIESVWNPSIMIKVFAPELFKNLPKIMWLDDDIILTRNLRELYKRDISNKYLSSLDVSELDFRYHSNHNKVDRWITAGIGIYNLDKMRNDNLQESFLKYAKEYSPEMRDKKLIIGGIEEYALTKAISKEMLLVLPYRYCLMPFYESMAKKHFIEQQLEISNVKSIHYLGPDKPWKKKGGLSSFFYAIWMKYHQMTPF